MANADFSPTKRFFVEMLVRDIELADAILDLLDNCVDGAQRTLKKLEPKDAARPYDGFIAEIVFNENEFLISDNCGGIPRLTAEHEAFRLGRPAKKAGQKEEELPTVGAYGIGMKRAIFKLGRRAYIASRHDEDSFHVDITPDWIDDDETDGSWELTLQDGQAPELEKPGTHIRVSELNPGVAIDLGATTFVESFRRTVSNYYSLIISKGFTVVINGQAARPSRIALLFDNEAEGGEAPAIRPYTLEYDGGEEGVQVKMAVGLFRRLPSEEEEDEELEGGAARRGLAGWTIIANDRVILFADRSISTGWGEARVPAYHSQFASIAGVAIFSSKHPRLLPITTTKRGVDGNSEIYLQIKDRMRTGLKLFTSFTNKWKKVPEQRDQLKEAVDEIGFEKAIEITRQYMRAAANFENAKFYQPVLPVPPAVATDRWIRFRRPIEEVETLSRHYFDAPDAKPSAVGERAFEIELAAAKK